MAWKTQIFGYFRNTHLCFFFVSQSKGRCFSGHFCDFFVFSTTARNFANFSIYWVFHRALWAMLASLVDLIRLFPHTLAVTRRFRHSEKQEFETFDFLKGLLAYSSASFLAALLRRLFSLILALLDCCCCGATACLFLFLSFRSDGFSSSISPLTFILAAAFGPQLAGRSGNRREFFQSYLTDIFYDFPLTK